MKKILFALALAGALVLPQNSRAQFASAVIAYDTGTGFAAGFTNMSAALGAPTSGAAVTPFAAPFSKSQIISIGAGGELTLQLDHAISHDASRPYGMDFALYANEFFVSSGGNVGSLFFHTASTLVQVSTDGSTWYSLNPALTPQPGELYPTDGTGNPFLLVNPSLTLGNFTGQNLAGVRSLYAGSAGGTAYDLDWAQDGSGNPVTLTGVDYIRIEVDSGVLDLDAVTVVPEPNVTALLLLGLAILFWRQLRAQKSHASKILLALFAAASIARADTNTFSEDFTSNPLTNGWQIFGDTNLFQWDATNHALNVTWDSSQPNSYFYHPLGAILGADDDFQFAFDLQFNDILAGVNSDKPDAIEVGVGLLNFSDATNAFVRGAPVFPSASPDPKNLAEFDYFPMFVDPFFGEVDASIAPTVVTSDFLFDGAFGDFFTMTNGVSYHVQMIYTASNRTMVTSTTLSGQTNILNTVSFTVGGTHVYQVDTFSISSYTDDGDPFDSLLAHGVINNLTVTTVPSPLRNIAGGFTNNVWQVQLNTLAAWNYTLLRTADFKSWSPASAAIPGNGASLTLQDTNTPGGSWFYRVNAQKP